MIVFSRFKIGVIVSVCLAGILFVLPNFLPESTRATWPAFLQQTVNLGLDLRGGSHLQLQVGTKAVTKDHLADILGDTRKALRRKQVKYSNLHLNTGARQASLEVTLLEPDRYDEVIKLIKGIDRDLVFERKVDTVVATLSEQAIAQRNVKAVDESIEVVRRRIDSTGTKEPNIQRQGSDRIVVELPGVSDPAEIKRLLGTMAKLTFHWLDESLHRVVQAPGETVHLPPAPVGTVYLPEEFKDGMLVYYPIKKEVIIQGTSLTNAQAGFDQGGQPAVHINFDAKGRKQMAEASQNVGKCFAIVLDNKVLSAPRINEPLTGGNCQISGNFTVASANELAVLLRAGALPAPLDVIEESVIGPSLGADSIAHGKNAVVMAFAIVAVFMLLAYSYLGLFADIALAVNIVLLFASLSALGATLTLPGIAGIALTIGMAVDANVLIFERIKEEIRTGLRVMAAIDRGYKRAFTAIVDSNLTTIIGAILLYCLGTGPVKGFAVTLGLGVVISMFTALTLTQLLLVTWMRMSKTKKLPF